MECGNEKKESERIDSIRRMWDVRPVACDGGRYAHHALDVYSVRSVHMACIRLCCRLRITSLMHTALDLEADTFTSHFSLNLNCQV